MKIDEVLIQDRMNGIEYDGIAVVLFLHEDGLDGIQVVAGAGALDEVPDHI